MTGKISSLFSRARLRPCGGRLRRRVRRRSRRRLAPTAPPQPVFLRLQLLDEFAAGLVEVRVDEVEVDPHAERHGHGEALLELDAVFAVAAAAAGGGLGRATVPVTGSVVRRGCGAVRCSGCDGRDEVGAGCEHVVVVCGW